MSPFANCRHLQICGETHSLTDLSELWGKFSAVCFELWLSTDISRWDPIRAGCHVCWCLFKKNFPSSSFTHFQWLVYGVWLAGLLMCFFLATQWHTSCKEESLPGTSQVVMSTLTESFWANDNNTSLPPCARREQACFQIVSWKIIQILMPPLFFLVGCWSSFWNTGPGVTWDPYKFTHSHSQCAHFSTLTVVIAGGDTLRLRGKQSFSACRVSIPRIQTHRNRTNQVR